MGKLYQETHQYIQQITPGSVFVEIGSDRWEGSTEYFGTLAKQHNTQLYTVDIDDQIKARLSPRLSSLADTIHFVVADGAEWSKTFDKPISILYLDNFDYNWEISQWSDMIESQKKLYKDRYNIEMNNVNCQKAHLQQMINLLPLMAEQSVVVCDDTYRVNDCFIGKCGAVIPYLLLNGYTIQCERDYGIILCR